MDSAPIGIILKVENFERILSLTGELYTFLRTDEAKIIAGRLFDKHTHVILLGA